MTWETHQILAVLNLAVCMGVVWACICRLNTHICRIYRLSRARYTLLLAGAIASGLQPVLWGDWPSAADVAMNLCVCAWLAIQSWSSFAQHDGRLRRKEDQHHGVL